MAEIWKPVESFDGYQVSNLGNVRSINRVVAYPDGRIHDYETRQLSPTFDLQGCLTVRLSKSGHGYRRRINQLVGEAFLGPNPGTGKVVHCDKDKTNNNLENLKWGWI